MHPLKPGLPQITWIAIVLALGGALSGPAHAAAPVDAAENETEFRAKLTSMLEKEEKSLKILRQQITESQNAPFLANLYLQLADLLSDRANTLYYIQQEKFKGLDVDLTDKRFSPVVTAEQEAIAVYKNLLRDFPAFEKRGNVLYRLTLALKSIDEPVPFMHYGGQLLREYPKSEEAIKTRLLIGQYYFEKALLPDAIEMLTPVANSTTFPFERNQARYKLGLISLDQEKFKVALKHFEDVILDPELKETDNPYALSLKERKVKSDLKREALIDSIRAYTMVHDKDPDPVGYYSRIAPTELHFQEIIEKLAVRYVNLKKYLIAVQLLRTLSERIAEPQRIIGIYKDVLMMIPVLDRARIPVEEIRFLLDKYALWKNYYRLSPELNLQAYSFFEKQVRSLATVSHDAGKATKDPARKAEYLARARDFYQLYLANFDKGSMTAKMAINLADVAFLQADYLTAGDIYLRIYQGEFGPAEPRKVLIENAVLALSKKHEYGFYDNVRVHGLLINAIGQYRAFDPAVARNPAISLLLLKTEYEQGFFPETLQNLYNFCANNRGTRQAVDAGELIMDYFNTRKDFAGLELWSGKLLSLQLSDAAFNRKLTQIKSQAKAGGLYEKIKATTGYDDFAQGKSYLTAAMRAPDSETKNAILQEALSKSKHEGDMISFFKTAAFMADKEPDPTKKADILKSLAREQTRLTLYYRALERLHHIADSPNYSSAMRIDTLEEMINLALLLRDWQELANCAHNPFFTQLSAATKTRIKEQVADLIESPTRAPAELVNQYLRLGMTADTLLPLYKAQFRIPAEQRQALYSQLSSQCGPASLETVCLWQKLEHYDRQAAEFATTARATPTTLPSIEPLAGKFKAIADLYRPLEASNDAVLNAAVAFRSAGLFNEFGAYLERTAKANPDLASVLLPKARETQASGKAYADNCALIARKSASFNPVGRYCANPGANPGLRELLDTRSGAVAQDSPRKDPSDENFALPEKSLFISESKPDAMLKLSHEYLNSGYYHHAAASASYSMSVYRSQANEFQTILGCSLVKLGLYGEAGFRLKDAASSDGLREKCQHELASAKGGT